MPIMPEPAPDALLHPQPLVLLPHRPHPPAVLLCLHLQLGLRPRQLHLQLCHPRLAAASATARLDRHAAAAPAVLRLRLRLYKRLPQGGVLCLCLLQAFGPSRAAILAQQLLLQLRYHPSLLLHQAVALRQLLLRVGQHGGRRLCLLQPLLCRLPCLRQLSHLQMYVLMGCIRHRHRHRQQSFVCSLSSAPLPACLLLQLALALRGRHARPLQLRLQPQQLLQARRIRRGRAGRALLLLLLHLPLLRQRQQEFLQLLLCRSCGTLMLSLLQPQSLHRQLILGLVRADQRLLLLQL